MGVAVCVFEESGDLVYDGDAVAVFELVIVDVPVLVVMIVIDCLEVLVKLGEADGVFD